MGLPELEVGTGRDGGRGLLEIAHHSDVGNAQPGHRPVHHWNDRDAADGENGHHDAGQCREQRPAEPAPFIILVGERTHGLADAEQYGGKKATNTVNPTSP